ncbi:MAG: class I SAM-dependent methyltransferase [Phycisphaerales bacterium]|jgi:cyclopropane fatty-acyl-phospholipid synthase-like methyltransferase
MPRKQDAESKSKNARATKRTARRKPKRAPKLTAATADRHQLYTAAVQNVEGEIDFVDETYEALRGKKASRLREDFCGTAQTSAEWVRRRATNVAVGIDLDEPTLQWGRDHVLSQLSEAQRDRLTLLNRDVRDPGRKGREMDVILAMNFSYNALMARAEMLQYLKAARKSLAPGGLFIMDCYGGYESLMEQEERRACKGFTYVWEQVRYNPISATLDTAIHFEFKDGTELRNAFTYHWRLWTIAELRDLLDEAGFKKSTAYWEGDDGKGGGDGNFKPATEGDADASWIAYIVSEVD